MDIFFFTELWMFLWMYVLDVNWQKKKEHIPVMFVYEPLRLFQHLRNFNFDSLSQSLILNLIMKT